MNTLERRSQHHTHAHDRVRYEHYPLLAAEARLSRNLLSRRRRYDHGTTLRHPTTVALLTCLGQEEDFDAVKAKALKLGAEHMVIQNCQQELIDELVWPAIQCVSARSACWSEFYEPTNT